MSFTIVTYNLRLETSRDGKNQFRYRSPLIKKKLNAERPDIICFQEVLPGQALWLKETLKDYNVIGCGRAADMTGEQMTVAYLKSRFDLIGMKTYWLSPTPSIPGSRYRDQSDCPRCASDVLLYDLTEKHRLRIIDTHLDHVSAYARKQGLLKLMRETDPKNGSSEERPTVLCGDFNAMPDAPELAPLMREKKMEDATPGLKGTFHNYGRRQPADRIDYIFIKGGLESLDHGMWEDEKDGVFLSDHYPVWARIAYRE